MPKDNIIFTPPAFHETRLGRAVLGSTAALITAGAAYWAFAPEKPNANQAVAASAPAAPLPPTLVPPFAAPVAAAASVSGRTPIVPDEPRYDSIAAPAVASAPVKTAPFVTLYPDVQSALRQFQRDDVECIVQRYTHRPSADGLVSTGPSPIGAISRENIVAGCGTDKMLAAFGNAAEVTFARRMNDLPNLQDAEDKLFPPVLMQVLAVPKTADGYNAPLGQFTLVCEQEGSLRRNDIRYKCRLGLG